MLQLCCSIVTGLPEKVYQRPGKRQQPTCSTLARGAEVWENEIFRLGKVALQMRNTRIFGGGCAFIAKCASIYCVGVRIIRSQAYSSTVTCISPSAAGAISPGA